MNTFTKTTAFLPKDGASTEYHSIIRVTDPSLAFEAQLSAVLDACDEASAGRTVHFRRFFLSDAANQEQLLRSALAALPQVATSIVQQPPLDGTRIAVWQYATSPMDRRGDVITSGPYAHHWLGTLTSAAAGAYGQMTDIFARCADALSGEGMTVEDNCIRTWIFVRDVDVNYGGVVDGRRDFFRGIGLTERTHYIASTGIEGCRAAGEAIVGMDSYSVRGLEPAQVQYLYAKDHLNPTYEYGVTFERGTAVTYGDRCQIFISGTASIDNHGEVLHKGDAVAQTHRLLENVSALLAEAGATLADIATAIVYLRDAADYPYVKAAVEAACPDLGAVFVLAPVCRPAWLVEMECIALRPADSNGFRDF